MLSLFTYEAFKLRFFALEPLGGDHPCLLHWAVAGHFLYILFGCYRDHKQSAKIVAMKTLSPDETRTRTPAHLVAFSSYTPPPLSDPKATSPISGQS